MRYKVTRREAIKELERDYREAVKAIKQIHNLSPDKFDGYIKGIADQTRIARNIIKKIDRL
jgi:hypothetical protein